VVLEICIHGTLPSRGRDFVSNDLSLVLEFLNGSEGESKEFVAPSLDPTRWQKLPFRAPNSISRAYVLALAAMRPRNLTTGAMIDTAVALSRYNKKEYHHVYPRAYLKRTKISGEHNAIGNICILTAYENNRVSDEDPNKYLPQCVMDLGPSASDVFRSNVLPDPKQFDYAAADYSRFLQVRSTLVARVVDRLCSGSRGLSGIDYSSESQPLSQPNRR
jgi:hypothetical protein